LEQYHLLIPAAARHQFIVRALFDDLAVFEHDDAICVGDGAQSMGDDEAGAAGHEVLQAPLDEPLALGVEIAGRFIENEDARVGEDRAGDGDALALTAAELDAALADERP
jgi:hypothetical protein